MRRDYAVVMRSGVCVCMNTQLAIKKTLGQTSLISAKSKQNQNISHMKHRTGKYTKNLDYFIKKLSNEPFNLCTMFQ